MISALVALPCGCRQPETLPLSGPDVFFNGERLARIVSVELADREAVLREYVGQPITARLEVTRAVELGPSVTTSGRYALHGRASDLHEGIDVIYTVYFHDASVLVHRVREPVEIGAVVAEVRWETLAGGQALDVVANGGRIRRLGE